MTQPVSSPPAPQTRGTLAYYANRVFTLLKIGQVNRYHFVRLATEKLPHMPRGYTVRPLERNDSSLAALVPQASVQAHRFDQHCVCLGAFLGDQLVGVTWFATGQFIEDEVRARYLLSSSHAWDLGLEIVPAFRRTRALFAVLGGLRQALEARNITASLSRIADSNSASLILHEKLGAVRCGTAFFVRLGGWQVAYSGQNGGLHLSTRPTTALPVSFGSRPS